MRIRELKVAWDDMKEGDRFVRYAWEGVVKRLIIEREAQDLPTHKGAMGYGVVEFDGVTYGDVLLVRRYDQEEGGSARVWVAPFFAGPTHYLFDKNIVEFKEMALRDKVLPGDLRDAIRDAIHEVGTESLGSLVSAVEDKVWAALGQD
jgi:hypothetical protein